MNTLKEGAMPRDLNIENRRIILDYMKDGESHTAAEISKALKISRQTVKKKLDFFVKKGIVVSCGKGTSSNYGGKRPEVYALNHDIYFLCAFQIFHTLICVGLFDLSGTCMDQCMIPHERSYTVEEYIHIMKEGAHTLISENQIPPKQIYEFLIGSNGLVDSKEGMVRKTVVNPHWGTDIPVVRLLKQQMDFPFNIRMENLIALVSAYVLEDAKMASSRTLVLYWGYGVSMRLIDKGHFEYGDSPICGEIENMVIDLSHYIGQNKEEKATLRSLISEKKIQEMLSALPEEKQAGILQFRDDEEIEKDIRLVILKAADAGNPAAKDLVEYMADVFFAALMNMVVCFDPEYIVFNGLPRQYYRVFETRIRLNFQEFFYFQDIASQKQFVFRNEDLVNICLRGSFYLMQKDFLSDRNLYEDEV